MTHGVAVHGVRLGWMSTRGLLLIGALLSAVACFEIDNELIVADNDLGAPTGVVAPEPPTPPRPPPAIHNAPPVAVCFASTSEVAPLYERFSLFGGDSYDPDGDEIVSYYWTLGAVPLGSSETWSRSTADAHSLLLEMSGDYRLDFTVTDEHGAMSEPCSVWITGVPQQDLWIELTWSLQDDLDLHLVRAGGSLFTYDDCHWVNCGFMGHLDWGVPGDRDDDPYLDIDDISGLGPENINITTPAPGRYEVIVDDYDTYWTSASNEALLRIYVSGVLEFERTFTVTGEETKTHLADIDFPGGIITPR